MRRSTESTGSAPAEPARRSDSAGGNGRAGDGVHRLLLSAFEHAPIGLALIDLDGRWIKLNPAALAVTGWSEPELLAIRLRDITHPDDRDLDDGPLQDLLAGRIAGFHNERRLLTGSGVEVWVKLSVAVARDGGGRPRHFIVQMQDISQAREAQRLLEQAEVDARTQRDHATAIIAAMSEGYVLTLDGEIKAVNDALCQLTGFPASVLVGSRQPYPFWPPEQSDAIDAALASVRRDQGGDYEIVLMRADGERFEAEVTTRPACEGCGRAIGFVTTVRDVSVQRRQQRELELMATTDQLTALANRHVLQRALDREASRRSTDKRQLALVLLDLDEFKQVNDVFGHPAGDAVLVEVARRLEATVRAGEVLARVGGEEFAWLLPASSADEAIVAADRARAAIAERPFRPAGRLTMSAGVGLAFTPSDGDALYRLADRALYEAKQRGRDRTCCHGGSRREHGRPARAV